MNLLDRYIFKSVLFTCLGAIGMFSFVVALGNFIKELLGPLLAGHLSGFMLVRLVVLLIPYAFYYALPMGMLTGVLLTLGRISADSEVTAMRAAGISIVRIARPIFILAVIGTAAALYISFEAMPWARLQYQREFAQAVRTNPRSFIVPKTFIRDFKGMVVYVGDRSPDGVLLRDIWIWELDNQSRVRRLVRAESGRLEYDETSNSLIPTLFHAKVEERPADDPEDFSKSPKAPSVEKAEEVRLSLAGYLGQNLQRVKPEWLPYAQLQKKRAELERQPIPAGKEKEARRERMNLALVVSEKANFSLAVLAFALIAVPLGIKVSRRETSANLGVAVVLVLGFYILVTMVQALDRHPEYRPDLLLWVPNILFAAFGIRLLRRVEASGK